MGRQWTSGLGTCHPPARSLGTASRLSPRSRARALPEVAAPTHTHDKGSEDSSAGGEAQVPLSEETAPRCHGMGHQQGLAVFGPYPGSHLRMASQAGVPSTSWATSRTLLKEEGGGKRTPLPFQMQEFPGGAGRSTGALSRGPGLPHSSGPRTHAVSHVLAPPTGRARDSAAVVSQKSKLRDVYQKHRLPDYCTSCSLSGGHCPTSCSTAACRLGGKRRADSILLTLHGNSYPLLQLTLWPLPVSPLQSRPFLQIWFKLVDVFMQRVGPGREDVGQSPRRGAAEPGPGTRGQCYSSEEGGLEVEQEWDRMLRVEIICD